MAGNVDEGRLKLHQWLDAAIELTCIAAFQRWHKLERGKGRLAVFQNVDDFAHSFMIDVLSVSWGNVLRE